MIYVGVAIIAAMVVAFFIYAIVNVVSIAKKKSGSNSGSVVARSAYKVTLDNSSDAQDGGESYDAPAYDEDVFAEPKRYESTFGGHHEQHCAIEHEDKPRYVVEKVATGGSIKDGSPEGCIEHYGVRFVKADDDEEEQARYALTEEAARRAIVLGEILNDPAFKRRGRRR